MDKIYFTYQDIQTDCEQLSMFLRSKNVDGIVPIIRGGVPPAIMLSYMLNKPLKMTVTSEKDVMVDEIVDYGTTFRKFKKLFPSNVFVCLHLNTKHFKYEVQPDYHVREVSSWVVYPWECDNHHE